MKYRRERERATEETKYSKIYKQKRIAANVYRHFDRLIDGMDE